MPLTDAERRVARLEHEAEAVQAALADLVAHLSEPELGRLQRAHIAALTVTYLSPAERSYCRFALGAALCRVRLARARQAVVEGQG
jgi:hypothetical protein